MQQRWRKVISAFRGGVLIAVGVVLGFGTTLMAISDAPFPALREIWNWVTANLGYSVWAFGLCLAAFLSTLERLASALSTNGSIGTTSSATRLFEKINRLDQLSDVFIHVFIGIGVIWTAIGMRSALVTTLDAPASLGADPGHVLARLVDGGILLALSTTIVGAVGGYVMRLIKTIALGPQIAGYYMGQERQGFDTAMSRLESMQVHLEQIADSQQSSAGER